jgi:uncharacterized protein YutE (UPF0331/DUF86 family)
MDIMIFVFLGIVIFLGTILFIFINRSLSKSVKKNFLLQSDREIVQKKWQEIEKLMELGGESRFKQAVLEADKLVHFVLKKLGYSGDDMADCMKAAKDRFSSYDIYSELWEAHKCRNRIVHEVDHELLHQEAQKSIARFEKTLKNLGGL